MDGTILLYHRVATGRDPFRVAVAPAVFEADMAWIRTCCQPMSLQELADCVAHDRVPARAVAVTLDDGYVDNLTTASDILAGLSIPATFFVTSASLEAPGEYWWDELSRLVLDAAELPPTLDTGTSGPDATVTTSQDRTAVLWAVHRRLVGLGLEGRTAAMARLAEQVHALTAPEARPMTGPEIRQLAGRAGHDVGAHTRNHLALASQPVAIQEDELGGCRADLERLLERPVRCVAYPFGMASESTVAIALATGYDVGVGVDPPSHRVGPLMLPRVDVRGLAESLPQHLLSRFG